MIDTDSTSNASRRQPPAALPSRVPRIGRWTLLGYLAVLALIIWGSVKTRQWAMAYYGSTEQTRAWAEDWGPAVEQRRRHTGALPWRVPLTAEPPALVLMRDRFAVCLGFAVIVGSGAYFLFVVLIRGALRSPSPADDCQRRVEPRRA